MAGGIIGGILGSILPGVLPTVADTAKILVDRLVPDPAKREQAEQAVREFLERRDTMLLQAITEQNQQQAAINLAEAQSGDAYNSRWRPTTAWICVAALGYNVLLAPVLTWFLAIAGVALGIAIPVPPTLDNSFLWTVLTGLLGLGALRSVDKHNGVAEPSAAAHNPAIPRR